MSANLENIYTSLPVGCVVAYAGNRTLSELKNSGWAICDGSELDSATYPALAAALGSNDKDTEFCLPDYRGYFLRGRPDSNTTIGTKQSWTTAKPKKDFYASVPHLPNGYHYADAGSGLTMLKAYQSEQVKSSSGGDSETRPINAYVYFIIKLTADAQILLGTIVPFAGEEQSKSEILSKYYMLCDGKSLQSQDFYNLYLAIGTAHGGTDQAFNLPDYRGYFLRGVSGDSNNDPDADSRTALVKGGNKGNQIGSIQDCATGLPTNPFHANIEVGDGNCDVSFFWGHENAHFTSDSTTITMDATGGDKETRPANKYVDFYILTSGESETGDIFPIGGIMVVTAVATKVDAKWLPCTGDSLDTKQYSKLYQAIGTCNGCYIENGTLLNFYAPNYQGYFLRGCDHGVNRDPDSSSRCAPQGSQSTGDVVGTSQDDATKRSLKGIKGQVPHLPKDDHSNATAGAGHHVAPYESGSTNVLTQGGDKETRPRNYCIDYYIKAQ